MYDECQGPHDKAYDANTLLSNPPKKAWICRNCGKRGYEVIGERYVNDYDEIVKRFEG